MEQESASLRQAGVDVITLGDNCFKKRVTVEYLERAQAVLRPVNSYYGNPGRGFLITSARDGTPVCVISAFGRTNVRNPVLDNPFLAVKKTLSIISGQAQVAILDFHCNATSEKLCMGYYLSGKISAVIGTHFSVQTADFVIDNAGTAYITDIGMVGGKYSIGGYRPEDIIESYKTGLFARKKVLEGDYMFNSLILEIDPQTGRTTSGELYNFEISKPT